MAIQHKGQWQASNVDVPVVMNVTVKPSEKTSMSLNLHAEDDFISLSLGEGSQPTAILTLDEARKFAGMMQGAVRALVKPKRR